jgi:hypothetical protein
MPRIRRLTTCSEVATASMYEAYASAPKKFSILAATSSFPLRRWNRSTGRSGMSSTSTLKRSVRTFSLSSTRCVRRALESFSTCFFRLKKMLLRFMPCLYSSSSGNSNGITYSTRPTTSTPDIFTYSTTIIHCVSIISACSRILDFTTLRLSSQNPDAPDAVLQPASTGARMCWPAALGANFLDLNWPSNRVSFQLPCI